MIASQQVSLAFGPDEIRYCRATDSGLWDGLTSNYFRLRNKVFGPRSPLVFLVQLDKAIEFPGEWRPTSAAPQPVVSTPFGDLTLNLQIDDDLLTDALPVNTYQLLNNRAQLWRWTSEAVDAQLAICEVEPDIPEGMSITACKAMLCRIRAARQRVDRWVISCTLGNLNTSESASPCSGQGLDAMEWNNGHVSVTLGTQDMLAMLHYRKEGGLVPERWATERWSHNPEALSFVEYARHGFVLRPPNLELGEQVQFQFVVAWANEPGDDIGPWYAVDMHPAKILAGFT